MNDPLRPLPLGRTYVKAACRLGEFRRARRPCYFTSFFYPMSEVMTVRWRCCGSGLLLAVLSVQATELPDLYRAEIAVTAQDDKSRREDLRRGLTLILGRLISSQAMGSKSAAALLQRAEELVEEYRYESPADRSAGSAPPVAALRMRFDRTRLNTALRQHGLAIWGSERPDILIWLTTEQAGRKQFHAFEEFDQVRAAVDAAAGRKGLPVVWPLYDLTDRANLQPSDLFASDLERIHRASVRYEAGAVLAGALRRLGESQWEGSWRLVQGRSVREWKGGPSDLNVLVETGLEPVYDRLFNAYASAARAEQMVEIRVTEIMSMTDASRCADYLRGLTMVTAVEWVRAEPAAAVWRLRIMGDAASLRQALAGSRVLKPNAGNESNAGSLDYRLMP